jgi:hypothetical protein
MEGLTAIALRTHLLFSINPTVGRPPFPLFLFVYLVTVASSIVGYSIMGKYQGQFSFAPRIVFRSLEPIVHLLSPPCIVFDNWYSPKAIDGRTDMHRHAQTNTDGQTDRSLCCVLCQRQLSLGAFGDFTFATDSQCLYKQARLYPFRSYSLMKSRLISPSSLLPILLFQLFLSSALV